MRDDVEITYAREEVEDREIVSHPELPAVLSRLQKGDAVPVHEVERLFGVSRDGEAYRLVCLRLRTLVEREFAAREPAQIVCVRVDSRAGVVVLTDDEAVEHTSRATQRHIRGVRRTHRKRVAVDRAKVAPANVRALDRAIEVGGRILSAIGRELRRPPPTLRPNPRLKPR